MWSCPDCKRIFGKAKQPHTCQTVPLEEHFKNKETAKELFNILTHQINSKVGKSRTISIPCCIHLFGTYDYLAALPKRKGLEVRFGLDRVLKSSRLKQSVPLSQKFYKNCIDLNSKEDIDKELISWINEAYHLKNKLKSAH